MSLVELFCHVDDFWQEFEPIWKQRLLASGERQRFRKTELSESEIMTILIHFHACDFRHFKAYYAYVRQHLSAEFPTLVSYERFIELKKRVGVALYVYLNMCLADCTGTSFIDSTSLPVCNNRRIHAHRVFKGLAGRGKTSMGWFYGFKLHLVINEHGEIIAFDLTSGNVHDIHMLDQLDDTFWGKLIGDKGYLSQTKTGELAQQGIQLITSMKRNMKQLIMTVQDGLLLRKRALVESVYNVLKNWAQIDHTRHRNPDNFFVNLISGLIAYCWKPNKPSIQIDDLENMLLNHQPNLA